MYMVYRSSDYVDRSKVAKGKVQRYGNCGIFVTGMVPRLILLGERNIFSVFPVKVLARMKFKTYHKHLILS
jgi:hypothetical protein